MPWDWLSRITLRVFRIDLEIVSTKKSCENLKNQEPITMANANLKMKLFKLIKPAYNWDGGGERQQVFTMKKKFDIYFY